METLAFIGLGLNLLVIMALCFHLGMRWREMFPKP